MAGHQSEFLKWSWRTSLPRALPWWSCAVFMLMTPTGMSPDLSFQPRLPSLTVYLTYPLTHPIHNSNVTCSELNSWSFSPKFVSLPPFSISGLSCYPFCCSGQLFQSHVDFFFSFIFYIYTIRKSYALCAQNISSIPPLLITTLVWVIMPSSPFTWTRQ